MAWQLADWPVARGGRIADTDNDGLREIVIGGLFRPEETDPDEIAIAVFETAGDNMYSQIVHYVVPEMHTSQSLEVLSDADGNGKPEILFGGFTPAGPRLVMLESVADNRYERVWEHDPVHSGYPVNDSFIVDAGDLDGDGRREFIAGGRRTTSPNGQPPPEAVFFVFEAVSDNSYEIVATFTLPLGSTGLSSATVADVDGDGAREIVIGAVDTVRVYRAVGNNAWTEIWSRTGSSFDIWTLEAGDYDRDGKDELLIQEFGNTGVYEINPAYAADADVDGVVDAIDNCPDASNHGQSDGDDDSVGDACDNCSQVFNPDQGPAVFGQTIQAATRDKLAWIDPIDIIYVRGPLSTVSAYRVDLTGSIAQATQLADPTQPAAGAGYFYLVRPDCPAGSWQSTVGNEPPRDEVLP